MWTTRWTVRTVVGTPWTVVFVPLLGPSAAFLNLLFRPLFNFWFLFFAHVFSLSGILEALHVKDARTLLRR
jgi:hypothetical protein